jgi:hypothetical protein
MCHEPPVARFRTQILLLLDFCPRMQGVSRALTDPAFQSGNPRLPMGHIQLPKVE